MKRERYLAWVDRLVGWAQKVAGVFSRLQWKLTLTYTVVTVGMLTLLLGVLMYFSTQLANQSEQIGYLLSIALADSTSELIPAMRSQPPDTAALDAWMQKTLRGTNLVVSRSNGDNGFSYSSIASSKTVLAFIDRHGEVIASNHADQIQAGGMYLARIKDETSRQLVALALNGEPNPALLHAVVEGRLRAVAPIRPRPDAPVEGVVLVQLEQPGTLDVMFYILSATLGSVLILTVGAGVIGMIFGLLTARGIAKRLKAVAEAAAAWGMGDFTRRVKDKTEDEIGFLARDLNKVAGQFENLLQTREDLAALEERNRLARDLHDSVKQQVFAATMNLGAAQALWDRDPQAARSRVDAAATLSRQSQQELTLLIQTLRPVQVVEKGLLQSLREHLQAWERNSGVTAQIQMPDTLNGLSMEAQEMLFRVCQEAFANIARHSGATAANLNIEQSAGCVILRISDNGHGFNPEKQLAGVGLRSMHERIQTLGGVFDVESGNTGTRIRVEIPLKR